MKTFKKTLSLITALAMLLGISFTALPNKVYADEKISIPFYVQTNVGEVEITVSNGSEEATKTVSKDGEARIEIGKIASGNYTFTAKQKELYKPDYDIIFMPKHNTKHMEARYSSLEEKLVNPEGFKANMRLEAAIDLYPESNNKIIDFEHKNDGEEEVMMKAPAKDINDMVRLNRKINVDANCKFANPSNYKDYTLKIDKGENPRLYAGLKLVFAVYYKPQQIINKADSDYKIMKAMMPMDYYKLCFSGDAVHKPSGYTIFIDHTSKQNFKIGVFANADGETYLSVKDDNPEGYLAKFGFTNKVLAEPFSKRDLKTESLEDLRNSNQDYKDIYAPVGGTILINWPQEVKEEKVLEHKIIKMCTTGVVESDEEKAILNYIIEVPTAHNFSKVHILDKFDAPEGATVKYIMDSIKVNGIDTHLDIKDYKKYCSENGFEFKVDELGQTFGASKYTDEMNKVDDETHNVTISYSVEVDKYGDYTNTAESYFGDFNYENEEKVAEDSVTATFKKVEKEDATYEKTQRDDIKIPDEDYDKAIIKYQKPFYKGYDKGGKHIFKPDNNISRAEIATVFVRILGIENKKINNPNMFNDLQKKNGKDYWAKDDIIRLAEYGSSKSKILNGYKDGSFKPKGNITRAQFAKMIATYWDIKGFKPNIKDANIADIKDHWAKDYITALYNHKFVELSEDKKFEPNKALTRAEVAQILNRITDRGLIKKAQMYDDVKKNNKYYDEINTASSTAK